jgi:voltage-gated potassium channel
MLMLNIDKFTTLKYIEGRRIHMLLISILMMVFGPAFMGTNPEWVDFYVKFSFILIVISCFLIIRKHGIARYISILTFLFIIIDTFLETETLNYLSQVGLSFLIFYAFTLVLKEAMSLKGNTDNMILISITGYLIIGLIGGLIAAGLAHYYPDAYSHSTGLEMSLFSFIYYSFVTMTTLGYGDIIPITDNSQSLAVLLVIAGQLFLSIIIGMNIAFFIQKRK